MQDLDKQLFNAAKQALENAYAPYSQFRVGASIHTRQGGIFTGCNVENSSYGLTICAERIALFKAVSEGQKEFDSLALISEGPNVIKPCGACRQVLAEFCSELRILLCTPEGIQRETTISELLPQAFGPKDLMNR